MLNIKIEGPFFRISVLPIVIVVLIYAVSYWINTPGTHSIEDSLIYEPELYRNFTPVYLMAIIINNENLTRMMNTIRYWGNDFKSLSPNSVFAVGSNFAFPLFPDISIVTKHRNVNQSTENHYIFEDHLKAFVENTTLRWFIRTTEDTFVHLHRLPKFISDLENRYDPLTDIILQGQVVLPDEIVHGGSGWIMSRAAAKWYWKNRDAIHSKWVAANESDDAIPMYFRDMLKWSNDQLQNSAFTGTPTNNEGIDRLIKSNFTDLPACPKENPVKLNETVFWHSGNRFMYTLTNGYQILSSVGNRISLGLTQNYSMAPCIL